MVICERRVEERRGGVLFCGCVVVKRGCVGGVVLWLCCRDVLVLCWTGMSGCLSVCLAVVLAGVWMYSYGYRVRVRVPRKDRLS